MTGKQFVLRERWAGRGARGNAGYRHQMFQYWKYHESDEHGDTNGEQDGDQVQPAQHGTETVFVHLLNYFVVIQVFATDRTPVIKEGRFFARVAHQPFVAAVAHEPFLKGSAFFKADHACCCHDFFVCDTDGGTWCCWIPCV